MTEEKRDPYKHKERWLKWRGEVNARGIPYISKANSEIILRYLDDMELGLNLGKGCPKEPRKPSRLNDLKGKMIYFAEKFEEKFNVTDLTKVTESQIHMLIKDMRDGVIKKRNGENFQDTKTFARDFKAFWNWWMKINRKKDIIIKDITEDLNTRPKEKATFVFLKKREIKRFADHINFDHKVIMYFLLDACIRPPTELSNIRVSDLAEDCSEVHIRDEIVKKGSFGRTNKLTFSSNLIRDYIRIKNLGHNDFLFNISSASFNKYIRRHAIKLFGTKMTSGGKPYHKLTMYDYRHIACVFWSRFLDKDLDIMKRFGWKQSNKIRYYSNFIDDDDEDEYDLITFLSGNQYELGEKKKSEQIAQLQNQVFEMNKRIVEMANLMQSSFATMNHIKEVKAQNNSNNSNSNKRKLSIPVHTD
jgi:integrase